MSVVKEKGWVEKMVSTINLVLMVVCVVVSIAALAVPYRMINKRSSALETGLPGALGYGFLGYIWQYVLYMFSGLFITKLPFWEGMNATMQTVVVNLLLTVITTLCTAAALYWGIYLTNQKQISIYRSATVGIGFAFGKIGLDLIYPYFYSFYLGLQINGGSYQGEEALKNSILNTTPGSLISGTYKCFLMFVIIFALALVMGDYYIAKNRKMAWIYVLCAYEVIMLFNAVIRIVFADSEGLTNVFVILVFTVVAAAAGLVLYHWFRTGQVEKDPRAVLRGLKSR